MSNSAGNLTARQSNVEILRILAAMGVIALHYNDGAMYTVLDKASNLLVLQISECVWAWPVNVFIMIMGYFSYTRKSSDLKKPITLIFQLIVFQVLEYVYWICRGNSEFSVSTLLAQLVPTDYFLVIYIALFLISPYLNILFSSFDRKGRRNLLFLLFLIFSVYSYLTNVLTVWSGIDFTKANPVSLSGDIYGHCIVNFVLCYLTGASISDGTLEIKKPGIVFLSATFCVVGLGFAFGTLTAFSYSSPFVILQAASLLSMFKGLRVGNIRIINNLAKAGITVYLTHPVLLGLCGREMFMWSRPWVLFAHIVLTQVGLFLAGYLIHQVYTALTEPMFKWVWKKVRLPEIRPIRIEK